MKYWGVIVTDPLLELKAQRNLTFTTTYLPVEWTGYSKRVIFSNYIFAEVGNGWQRVFSTRGCRRWMLVGEKPAKIDSDFIKRLKALENKNGHIVLPPSIVAGDEVVIQSGSFAEKIGIYQGQNSEGREGVLLSLLGQAIVVPVKRSQIELLSVIERNGQVSKFNL